MRAVQLTGMGGPDSLVLADLPKPAPGPGEILIRIGAAGVSSTDWKLRDGAMPAFASAAFAGLAFPLTLGWDFSGVVEAAGREVNDLAPGAQIVGMMPARGGFAEYGVLAPDIVAPKPARLSHAEAVALVGPGLTAWFGVVERGQVRAGQRVLIHAAAGSVGHLAVQLAREVGAQVIATASSEHHDFLKRLGADQVIDYRAERFEQSVGDLDMVFDLVGGEVEARSWGTLAPGGVLVSAIRPLSADDVPVGKRGVFVAVAPNAAALGQLTAMAEAGRITPSVRAIYPLAEANPALDRSREGHGRGRVVIDPSG